MSGLVRHRRVMIHGLFVFAGENRRSFEAWLGGAREASFTARTMPELRAKVNAAHREDLRRERLLCGAEMYYPLNRNRECGFALAAPKERGGDWWGFAWNADLGWVLVFEAPSKAALKRVIARQPAAQRKAAVADVVRFVKRGGSVRHGYKHNGKAVTS